MKKAMLLILALQLIVVALWAQATSRTYSSAGSYNFVVPPGYVANITVHVWGGGGAGASSPNDSDVEPRGGGGGGGYATRTFTNVPADSYSVTVGAGGVASTGYGTSTSGNSSSFSGPGGEIVTGNGGTRGSGQTGGGGGSTSGGTMGSATGGSGGSGAGNGGGGGGGSGTSPGSGLNGSGNNGGNGGSSGGGNGGGDKASGFNGTAPGGGGGGGGKDAYKEGKKSGNGGTGQVIVTVTSSMLPVTLAAFETASTQEGIELKWTTSAELNNEKFIIETSTQGEVFNRIGEVLGAGTSAEGQSYQFQHRTPSAGTNYYRLKQVDFDGTFEYSKVIAIQSPGSKDVFVFPNPAKDKLQLQYDQSKGTGRIQLFDALGRVLNVEVGGYPGNYEIKLPNDLPRGNYWLKVERQGKIQAILVAKQ